MLAYGLEQNGLRLAVLVDAESLSVTAFQTPVGASDLPGILENHAHKIVGTGSSLPDAIVMAEIFAREWEQQAGTFAGVAPCMCGEIGDLS